ncbi:MAG: protein translocase subunit SecD [Candidatus Pacebacteria bacterium]|nr:protein translocase subunit SecD [Candidatus Paceibacterota bacterium]
MSRKNTVWSLFFIIILAVAAGFFCFPKHLNQGIGWINETTGLNISKISEEDFRLGLDLKGGVRLEYQADLEQIEPEDKANAMEGLRDVIERRINIFGVAEPQVIVSGNSRLMVELPGVEDIEEAKEWIGQTPWLEFLEEREQEESDKIIAKIKEVQEAGGEFEKIQEIEDWQMALENPYYKKTDLNSRYFKKASLNYDQTSNDPIIEIEFNEEGSEVFEQITERNVGKTLAIMLDNRSIIDVGEGMVYAPRINEKIEGGRAIITGQRDIKEAKTIVLRLNQGALPVQIGEPISESKIGPTLGKISLEDTLKAGLLGFALIFVFMVLYYRLPGLLASLALAFYAFLLLAIFKMISVTLTLAGIGGVILSIGMAVDANILIFTRMNEELKQGKSFGQSVEEGFNRAWPAIRDGNATTLLVGFILLFLGTSFVKGFATTLNIGILLSMFTAIVVTRTFLRLFIGTRLEKITWLWK